MSSLQRLILILFVCAVVLVNQFGDVEARINTRTTPMHKVLLTQRGYIQFLRWELPIPEIREFTYCIWIKSVNFSLQNTIFSYSHNETKRQISSWVSPYGRSIHLEIGNVEVMSAVVDLQERRWYHICQSWDGKDGQYAMWLDAQMIAHGYAEQMAGHVIPANGDPVVGQEYTDFNKGLEEGIEGAVLGFNLLLVSSFSRKHQATSPFKIHPPLNTIYSPTYGLSPIITNEWPRKSKRRVLRRIDSDPLLQGETIGEYLIRMTYENCQRGRTSPFINPTIMIISWTRTPVKIFGGAIVKNALNTCGRFG